VRDEIGAASRECRRVMPASAVPDQSHAGAVLPRDRFDPALDTLALSMIRLTPGAATTPVRTTANNIYACVSGEGETTVGDEHFVWQRGDVLVAPAWDRHVHRSSAGAVLFRVSDEPISTSILSSAISLRAFCADFVGSDSSSSAT